MDDKLSHECLDGELPFRSSRQRDNNKPHTQVHSYAVKTPEEHRALQGDWQTQAECVVNGSHDDSNQEMKRQAETGGPLTALESRSPQRAAGDKLQEPLDRRSLCFHEYCGSGYVEHSRQTRAE